MVTDVQRTRRRSGPTKCVVFLQQRYLGLPVYDGRRSVIFGARGVKVTGTRIPVGTLSQRLPTVRAQQSVRKALEQVFGNTSRVEVRRVTGFPGPERFAAFRCGEIGDATTHLCVFNAGPTHLAWVVDLVQDGGLRFELIFDARTGDLLRRRVTSLSADACITCPPVEPAGAHVPYTPGPWAARALEVSYDNAEWTPPAATGSLVCGTTVADLRPLNAYCLANHALDVAGRFVNAPSRLKLELFADFLDDAAAAAFADGERVVLKGRSTQPTRHAAFEPTVVLHEVAHVVLNCVVGGSAFALPFESEGRSRAVTEGLSDFLALTLWNSLCRKMSPARADTQVFAAWFLVAGRDYAAYYAGNAVAVPDSAQAHLLGRRLCGAFLLARSALVAGPFSEDQADDALWDTLLRGLVALPHQGDLPDFCCVRDRARAAAPAAVAAEIETACDAMQIPAACPHVS